MLRSILSGTAILAALLLLTSLLPAHGGGYQGPRGGGTPSYRGPVGGTTPSPGPTPGQPNSGGGGSTPGTGDPGSTPNPGGTGAPVRPGGNLPSGPSRFGGGRTPGVKKADASPQELDWDWWWDLNDDRFLLLKHKVRTQAAASTNVDTLLTNRPIDDEIAQVTTTQIRREILPSLKLALKDSYYDARAAAVIALGKVADAGMPEVLPHLMALLADSDNRVQESACLGLGLLGNKEAVPELFEIASNTEAGRRLCGMGSADIPVRCRAFAAVGIGLIGNREGFSSEDGVIKKLVALATAKAPNADVQVGAALALQLVRDSAVIPELLAIFKDAEQDRWVRAHIGVALGKAGAKSVVPELRKALRDKETYVAQSAAIALGLLTDREDRDTVKDVIRYAKAAPDRGTRNFCLIALGEIGAPEGKAELIANVMKGQFADQSFSAMALGVMGNKFREERAEIGEILLDAYRRERSDQARAALAVALGLVDHEPAMDLLRADLASGKGLQELKGHLCTALGLLGDREAIPAIQAQVKQKGDQALRESAAIALGLLQDADAVDLLKRVIDESSNSKAILGAATVALGFIGDRRAVPVLVEMVENAKNDIQNVSRAFATVALGYLGDKDDIPLLSKIHASSNYLAPTHALLELLTIL